MTWAASPWPWAILVDDATVPSRTSSAIAGWHGDREAILDGAAEIAVPALVSTLCIWHRCPAHVRPGWGGPYLFVPLAEAVIFAMLALYVLSGPWCRLSPCTC